MDSILSPGVADQNIFIVVVLDMKKWVYYLHYGWWRACSQIRFGMRYGSCLWRKSRPPIDCGGVTPTEWRGQRPRIAAAPKTGALPVHGAKFLQFSCTPLSGTSIWFTDLVIYFSLFWVFYRSRIRTSIHFNLESHQNLPSIQSICTPQ